MRLPRAPTQREALVPRQSNPTIEEPAVEETPTSFSLTVILTITFLTLATLLTLLVTVYCILSRRLAARARASALQPSPSPPPSIEVIDTKSSTQNFRGKKNKRRGDVPTLVFRQHEPEKYGFFAPLYFSRWRKGGDMDGVQVEDVKEDLARVFEPAILERGQTDGESSAAVVGGKRSLR